MKRVLHTLTLLAALTSAAFMTGCGDDNNGNNNNTVTVAAPTATAVQGRTFTLADGSTLTLAAAGNGYTYKASAAAATETGTYVYTPSANTATIRTTPDAGAPAGSAAATFNLTFTSSSNSQYGGTITKIQGAQTSAPSSFQTTGGTTDNTGGNTNGFAPASLDGKVYKAILVVNGATVTNFITFGAATFTEQTNGVAGPGGTYAYSVNSTNGNIGTITEGGGTVTTITFTSATVGTFTNNEGDSGSVTESSVAERNAAVAGNNGGNNTGTAPSTLSAITIIKPAGQPYEGTYNYVFNANGTYTVGGNSGAGQTFTYQKTGDNTATLRVNYSVAGEFDEHHLTFTSATSGDSAIVYNDTAGDLPNKNATATFTNAAP